MHLSGAIMLFFASLQKVWQSLAGNAQYANFLLQRLNAFPNSAPHYLELAGSMQ